MRYKLFIFAILTLALAGLASENAEVRSYGTSISVPPGWSYSNMGIGNVAFQISAPVASGDVFQANLNLVVTKLDKVTTEENLRSNCVAELQLSMQQFRLISKAGVKDAPYWHIYEYTINGMRVKAKQVMLARDSKAFVLTYTALAENYERLTSQFEAIIKSFKISG